MQAIDQHPTSPEATARSDARAWWLALAAAGIVLGLAYAPNLSELFRIWTHDENYTHGFLVVPIALFILWRRIEEMPGDLREGLGRSAPWPGWALLTVALVARAIAYERNLQWVETATLLPAVVGLVWAFGGVGLIRLAWPAILFLVFMLPLPVQINSLIALPLQRIAATGSYILLQLSGFWLVQSGNILHLTTPFGTRPLDVALACSGLKMLMTLAATVTATILLLPLPNWKRIILMLSAIPIALVSNISRIVATGWCYYYLEGESGQHWAHDISGWMMMPMALVLVGLELKILAWLSPETPREEAVDENRIVLPLIGGGRSGPVA